MAARLATGAPAVAGELGATARAERSASARNWFASLAVSSPVRAACVRLVDAAARADSAELVVSLAAVVTAGKRHLDDASVAELERIIDTLREP